MNLLLAEDDELFARALEAELGALGHAVTRVGDGRQALERLDRTPFDAVIVDWMMPAMDGVRMLQSLREDGSRVPVIMLSARGRSVDKVEGLETGADDYVVKPVSGEELVARVQAVLRGRTWAAGGDDDTIRAGDIVVSPRTMRAWRGDRVLELGNLEFRLLAEFVRNSGAVLTRAMLLDRVWGYQFEPATNIVEVYIRRLRMKLNAAGEADRIATVRGVGYVLRD